LPGRAVGAGGARTLGEKLLAPPGVTTFSVGVGVVDVVVVVVLDGVGVVLVLHPAVNAPIVMIALPPATNASRRAKRSVIIVLSILIPVYFQPPSASRWCSNMSVNMMSHSEQTVMKFLKVFFRVSNSG
jgi:hypothetical protein